MAKKKTIAKKAKKTDVKKSASSKKSTERKSYPEALKQKVVKAIRKGMTHIEASEHFEVGKHSIPNWLKRFK